MLQQIPCAVDAAVEPIGILLIK